MQKDPEAILLEYKDADLDRRLNMFMGCRELRDHFRVIDFNEMDDQGTTDKTHPKSTGFVRNVMGCIVGALTRFMRLPDLGKF